MKAREILIALYVKHNGEWMGIYKDISEKVCYDEKEVIKTAKEFESKHKKVITLLDDEYPFELKQRYMPPFVLVKD